MVSRIPTGRGSSVSVDTDNKLAIPVLPHAPLLNLHLLPSLLDENVQGGMDRFRPGVIELLYKLAAKANLLEGGQLLIKEEPQLKKANDIGTAAKETKPLIVPVIDDTVL